ncbi:MAG: S8 family serine peptidase [Saprospiraceae bacterium]|nr:S8 family serine peptidase [Saprospiraceae bacterium]
MFSSLYPFTFVLSLAALSGWFFYRDHERRSDFLRKIFLGSFAAFGTCWLLSEGQWSYKFPALLRELVVLGAVPVVLSIFRKTKWGYVVALLGVLTALRFFYFEKLKNTFPQADFPKENTQTTPAPTGLDPQGELLLELKEGVQLADIQAVLNEYGLSATAAFTPKDLAATQLDNYFLVDVPASQDFPKVKKALASLAQVEWLEENEQVSISPIEVQPMQPIPGTNKKYGINDPGLSNLWGFEAMKVDELYNVLKDKKPKKRALIAILDTGVDAKHEDLKANFTSTKSGYDTDKAGHGTHCAGIAAAVSNNGVGVASFSQTNDYVRVTSIKVLSDGGSGTQQSIINGMLEAADIGADVLSLSLGGMSSDSRQRAYQKALDYANKKGCIVVVAAGNSNRNAKDFVPANVDGVITVSAVDTLLNRASFSNMVPDVKMGVAAPGVKIYSTIPGSIYATFNGTSMATPYVAGLLGLMKSMKPDLTTKEAYQILNETGAETKNTKETGRLIQPGAAVRGL